jgi:hypothetical protein
MSPLDDDCDGIPDAVDQCTDATVTSDPACGGSTWPLPPNTHDTVFHVLDEGRSASDALQISYRVRSADVYFLLDTSDTMSEERDELLKALTGTRLVDCALLKNCCDALSGTAKTNCMDKVDDDDQAKCLAAEPTYCKSSTQTDCADTDGDGAANNENQDDGVVGAVRCLVGDSWFGAGMFRELPFRDGVTYVSLGADDAKGFQDRGSHDEWAFRNYSDMTSDVEAVRSSLESLITDGNYDYPEASMIALYSLLTGKGGAFGNESPSIADRNLRGCGPFSFGYPCFRTNAVPVIVLFTDDPMNNGPGVYSPGFGETKAQYDKSYALNGAAPSSGVVQYTPDSAEEFVSALPLGDEYQRFDIAAGNLRDMRGDYSDAVTGCSAPADGPEAVVGFQMTGTDTVGIALNVAQDPLGYSDAEVSNEPTSATQFPTVISLYRGDPTNGGKLLQCKTVCPQVAPYDSCKPVADSCSFGSQCCSGSCSGGKCRGPDPAGTRACSTSELSSNGFSLSLKPDDYYVTVKARGADEAGFFELHVGNPGYGSSASYVPPRWSDVTTVLDETHARVLPVVSCGSAFNGRCDGTIDQATTLAAASGVIDPATKKGEVLEIDPDGTGLGSGLAMKVRDLSSNLTMDITLGSVGNPGFDIQIQKCTDLTDPVQAALCASLQTGCTDSTPGVRDTITACKPGALPKFAVQISNPAQPKSVPPNPGDPFGGYHFALQLFGNHTVLLDEIPVYIIPTERAANAPPASYADSGSYEQQLYGKGCGYYAAEGEGDTADSCTDMLDNDMDGMTDAEDPDCQPGSCLDKVDNDKDGKADGVDPDCSNTQQQEWTDLFYDADIPPGTSISFDGCTALDPSALKGCTYSHIATASSLLKSCTQNADCLGIDLGSGPDDGFCGASGQCQKLTPQKLGGTCADDDECPNGSLNGKLIATHCDLTQKRCLYTTQPAALGSALAIGEQALPYLQLKITLNADATHGAAPTLYQWSAQYVCRDSR